MSLFYYAGHGMQVRGKNFLIPIDAEIETEGSVHSEAVDVDQLLNQLGPARLSMVILDACRNNPFERRFRSTGSGGLAQIDAPTGTLLAYATAPGKVASDGTGSNGLYTEALLKALDTPGLKVEDVFKQVRINVLKASDSQQIPWESSSLTGEFFFRSPLKSAAGLEKFRGQLTFSKAVAILLDVNSPEELTQLLTHEREIKRKVWPSSYAIGTDNKGNLIWGGGYGVGNPSYAAETALQQCAASPGDSCKVVTVNGEFREKDFIEVAKQLGARDVAATRQVFMTSLTAPLAETQINIRGGGGGAGRGYSPTRK